MQHPSTIAPRLPKPLTPAMRAKLRKQEGGYATLGQLTALAASVNARRLSQ